MKHAVLLFLWVVGCASRPLLNTTAPDATIAKGPWSEVAAVEMPTGDSTIPIELLRDVADALLKRPGAKVCDLVRQRPIVGMSTEYCSTVYVAGELNSLSWRVTEPIMGDHRSCRPRFAVEDDDFPSTQVWVVGFVHNHPCGTSPSSEDLGVWPTDAFDPFVAMAAVRLVPGNPAAAMYKNTPLEMASALVAERQDGTRVFLRYFPTGEIQQWSNARADWVTLGTCAPRGSSRSRTPRCSTEPLPLLRE
jgi:proteasome lid subunit RPN8/RPN11